MCGELPVLASMRRSWGSSTESDGGGDCGTGGGSAESAMGIQMGKRPNQPGVYGDVGEPFLNYDAFMQSACGAGGDGDIGDA